MTGIYNDIIHLPHHTSVRHPRMMTSARAAQFSAYAALNGHDDAIKETARLTGRKIQLAEDEKAALDQKLQQLIPLLPQQPEVVITHYVPDLTKDGGAYLNFVGRLKKLDSISRMLCFTDGTMLAAEDILTLDSPHLKNHLET